MLASILGGLFAVSAQLLRAVYDERRKRSLMVKMMHQELRKNFLTIYEFWNMKALGESQIRRMAVWMGWAMMP